MLYVCRILTVLGAIAALTVGLSLSSTASAPSISQITAASANVGLYEKFELTCNVTCESHQPYWPYDESPNTGVPARVGITVDGLFSRDNWQTTITQPAFYYQPYTDRDPVGNQHTLFDDKPWLYPTGDPVWCVRFAPSSLGTWKYKIRVTDSGGTTTSAEGSFTAVPGSNHGFVRVSPTDSRYFETSDGTYLPLVGMSEPRPGTSDVAARYSQLRDMGVNLLRSWWQSSCTNLALFGAGGQGGDLNWLNLEYSTTYVRPGHLVSAVVPSCSSNDSPSELREVVAVKPLTSYKLAAVVKTVGVTGTGNCGLQVDAWAPGLGVAATTRLRGDNDWQEQTVTFTTGASDYSVHVHVGLLDIAQGRGYCSDISLKEALSGGRFGPELMSRGDFQAHTSYPQPIAWAIDKQLDTAAQDGLYIKAVIEEQIDSFFACIQPNGTWGAFSSDNVYATLTHAGRTYQKYYWRYLIARWGYSTALHSLEFVNEGDPFNAQHVEATNALAEYVAANDPNKHLASTSNWHSFSPLMWHQPAVGLSDLHMYLGWGVASGGNRLLPGWDGTWTDANYTELGSDQLGTGFSWDTTTFHSGKVSMALTIPETSNVMDDLRLCVLRFQCGALSGHRVRISAWCKANNVATWADWKFNGLMLLYSTTGGDYYGRPPTHFGAPNGTYDWQLVEMTFTVPSVPNGRLLLEVKPQIYLNKPPAGGGQLWIDDLVIMDLDTGVALNYNGGFEYQESESYDVVAGHCSYSQMTRGFQYGKPTVRGEVGFCHQKRFTDPYKGFSFTGEDQLLIDDAAGVFWKKWVWANIDPGGLCEVYWWSELLMARNFHHAKAFQNFMSGIPVSNGHYVDAAASVSDPGLRVLGQKDLTNNAAHIWIDNIKQTWKNVVDGVSIPPVSGTITLSGFTNGSYKAEWWNTTAGTLDHTQDVTCVGGNIVLTVQNLASDVACRISAPQPAMELRITVPSDRVVPGQTVPVTLQYTNSGASEARNVVVKARVPAQMDYVPGSAEATGGVYNAQEKSVSWVVDSVGAGQTGSRVFQAVVQ